MMNAPEWVQQLVNSVADAMTSINSDVELGCHVYQNDSSDTGEWEITVFGEPIGLGGRLSAYAMDPVFSIDAFAVATAFDTVLSCRWQTGQIDAEDDLGPHLSIEGIHHGEPVWLRIVSQKPKTIAQDSSNASQVRNR